MKKVCNKVAMLGLLLCASGLWSQSPDTLLVQPRASTSPVISDADDPAIWVHPTDPSQSLILGTDKGTYPDGGIFVWGMEGALLQRINVSHPNNIDVRYGMKLGGGRVDVAVTSMRDHRQIRVYKIDPVTRTLEDITTTTGINIFKAPYGLALYQRPSDDTLFAIVSSKHDDFKHELWQIRLAGDGEGRVKGTVVRKFGVHTGIVEGLVVDDELGYLYASGDHGGIDKYYADPEKGNAHLVRFGMEDSITANHEGLALYKCANSAGYLLSSRPGIAALRVYRREGDDGNPHEHSLIAIIRDTDAKNGDGIEVTNRPTSSQFRRGMLVWHNKAAHNFRLYAWEEVAQNFLTICPSGTSNAVDMGAFNPGKNEGPLILQQNHPNPFNPATEIQFEVRNAGEVQLTIHNLLGEEVRRLLHATLPSGKYSVRWDARDDAGMLLASGIYFYQVRAGQSLATRRMILSR